MSLALSQPMLLSHLSQLGKPAWIWRCGWVQRLGTRSRRCPAPSPEYFFHPIFHANDDDGDGYDDDGDAGHLSDHQHKLRPLLCSLRYSSVKKMIMGILDAKFYLMTHPNKKQWKRRNMVLIRRSQS